MLSTLLRGPRPTTEPACLGPDTGYTVREPLVTVYCQMALPSEPVVSTSALNVTTLIPFPRWWQRDNAAGILESLEWDTLIPFQEDAGIC